jgi:hypothetical protein
VVAVLTPHTVLQMVSVYSANECIQGAVGTGACDTDWATEADVVTRSRRGNDLKSRALVQRINHRIPFGSATGDPTNGSSGRE